MPAWLSLMFLVGIPFALAIVIVAWIIDHVWLTPKEAKILKKATRKKKPLIVAAFDNGQCGFKIAKEIGDEGYIKTEDKWVGFLPRPISEGNPGEDEKAANPLITRVFTLENAKIPFLVGYSGKAVLTNPQALAIIEHAEQTEQPIKIPLSIKKGGKKLSVNIFWPINLTAIKKVFPKSWNQAQVRALEKQSELTGIKKGEKYYGREGLKYFVLPGMIIIAIIVLSIIFLVLGK